MAKITGKEGLKFTGKARTFDTEDDFVKAVESGSIKKGEKTVVILRYLGPQGGPGQYFFRSPIYPTFSPSLMGTHGISFLVFSHHTFNLRFLPIIGMPEMLKPTSLIMGAGLGLDVACLTDGRFSGGCVIALCHHING